MSRTAILLMAFGGPESLDQIGPFMEKLMGRSPAQPIIERVAERYRAIGGGSPLPRIVREQAAALERALKHEGAPVVRPAFKYAEPSIAKVVADLASQGFSHIVGVSLSPHYSRISTGAYLNELQKAVQGIGVEASTVDGFHTQPSYLDAIAEKTREALSRLDDGDGDDPHLIFTAHSLPVEHIEQGDPYVQQIEETIDGIRQRMPGYRWHLTYQSRGQGQGRWLEPEVETVLEELAAEGQKRAALVPISFTCDHIETLYDIDVVIAEKARALGMKVARAEALNTSSLFIDALAAAVRPHLAQAV